MTIRFPDDKVTYMGPEQPADNPVAQVATGVGKAVEGFITFPTAAFQYITGTTNHLGEIGSWARFGSKYKVRADNSDNPLTRAALVANHIVFGTIDLVLGHLPYSISAALGTQNHTPFFSPPPATIEGMATEATNIAFLFALPKAGSVVKAKLGIPAKTAPVSEGALFKELAEATERAELAAAIARHRARLQAELAAAAQGPEAFKAWMQGERGLFGSQRGAVGITVPKMSDAALAQNLATLETHSPELLRISRQQFKDGRFDLMQVIRLAISNGVGSQQAVSVLDGLASPFETQHHAAFTAAHLTVLIPELSRPHRKFDAMLETLADFVATHFQASHVDQLVAIMQEPGHQARSAAHILLKLSYTKPELFTAEHLDPLMSVSAHAAPTFFSNKALARLAICRRDLFTDDYAVVARIKAINETPDETYRGCLQKTMDALGREPTPPAIQPSAPQRIATPVTKPEPVAPKAEAAPIVPGPVQFAEVLQITPDRVADHLQGLARLSQAGIVTLTRCQSDAAFRNALITALQQMQRETPQSSWLGEALKHVQKSAATESDLEI